MSTNKTKKTNAFKVFLSELNHNRRVDINEALMQWSDLLEEEKDEYRRKARRIKAKSKTNKENVSNNVMQTRQQSDLDENQKTEFLKEYVQVASDLGELDDKVFLLISIQTFFEDDTDAYPCELAIVKFSLKRGVFDELHLRINPGKLPMGAAWMALKKSNETHKYPLPEEWSPTSEDHSERNYSDIVEKIAKFLSPITEFPFFIAIGCKSDEYESMLTTQRALQTIFKKAGKFAFGLELQVYSACDLLFCLRSSLVETTKHRSNQNSKIKPFSSYIEAHDFFVKTECFYLYSVEGCKFHMDNDVLEHCCLTQARRCGYVLSINCCNPLKYNLVGGCHYPKSYVLAEN